MYANKIQQKKVAIVQSNYIPWKGYFDLINLSDEFILFDNVQYTRRDWRNRNRIKVHDGAAWLTIPVTVKGKYFQRICDTEISDHQWGKTHWGTIRHNYAKARYFKEYADFFEKLYIESSSLFFLSQINFYFLSEICHLLGIHTRITRSTDYNLMQGQTERLISLCQQVEATEYLSGPSARSYLDEKLFDQAGITLRYMDYSGYPEYEQVFPPFDHHVSIVDLILNTGPAACEYLKSFK